MRDSILHPDEVDLDYVDRAETEEENKKLKQDNEALVFQLRQKLIS